MARITVEDCLKKVSNRFALVLLSSKRTRQLLKGKPQRLKEPSQNKPVVISLREIEEGSVRFMTPDEQAEAKAAEEQRKSEQAAAVPGALLRSPLDIPLPTFGASPEIEDGSVAHKNGHTPSA